MKQITINNFGGGIADDIYNGGVGEFSIAKQFDILSYPNRLKPLRGMVTESTTNSKIGNIIVASDGLMYGVGEDPNNPGTSGELWYRQGYGASDVWAVIPTNTQLSGSVYNSAFLVEFPDAGNSRKMFWASANKLVASDKSGASGATTQALTFTFIGQGIVHPTDKILYYPYTTSTASYIGSISPNATPFASKNDTALTLSFLYRCACLSYYGNYLAIPAYSANGVGVSGSVLYLWDRVNTTWNENIAWGSGQLKVFNNLNGTLIGISGTGGTVGSVNQDQNSIVIKGYQGGEPFLIKELIANHYASSSSPVVTINSNVNFIYKDRLYFSVNIVPTDGISNTYYGLWSIGKNKQGRWTVNMERVATNANTETGVLACAMTGDFVSMVHTADGTLTYTINGQTSSTSYAATSVYESVVNPQMPLADTSMRKKLYSVLATFVPLTTGQQVVLKYRVDSKDKADWITLFTKTSTSPDTNLIFYNTSKPTSGQFREGTNFEFRLESTGGAEITSFSYTYNTITT